MQELERLIFLIGKSCFSSYLNFFCRYVKGKLPQNKPSTIGVEFATKNVELRNGGGIVKAQIWDTGKNIKINPNHSRSREIQGNYISVRISFRVLKYFRHYRRAVGALVVYDVTKEETFIHAKTWMEELK